MRYEGNFIDQLFAAVAKAEEQAEIRCRIERELRESIAKAASFSKNVSEPVAIQQLSVA